MSDLEADPQTEAEERGLALVVPGPDELFLDIDDADAMAWYQVMLLVLEENGAGALFTETKTTTSAGGNTHVYLRAARPLTDVERVAFQACLGSDRKRELLSLLRLEFGVDRPPTVFFEVALPSGEAGPDAEIF